MQEPQELEVIDAAISRAFLSVHKAFPAKVRSYDNAKQTLECEPVIERADLEIPVLSDVPVVFPGGGDFFLSFPIVAGDFVLIVCCDVDFSQWSATGDKAKENFRARHGLNAVAIPMLRPSTKALASTSATEIVLGKSGAGGLRSAFGTEIKLGEGTQFVALANLVATELTRIQGDIQAIFTWANSHTHATAAVGTPVPGVPVLAGVPTNPASVAATKVKAL